MAPVRTEASSVAGALQLGLVTTVVRYTSASLDYDDDGIEVDYSELVWGFADNPTGIEIAYGLSDQVLLGGRLTLGGASDERDQAALVELETSSFELLIAPKLEYMFDPTATINPFVGALLGVNLRSTDDGLEASQTVFVAMARAGLRCFLADGFSLDPALEFSFGVGGGSSGPEDAEADYSLVGLRLGLTLGVSGWLR